MCDASCINCKEYRSYSSNKIDENRNHSILSNANNSNNSDAHKTVIGMKSIFYY